MTKEELIEKLKEYPDGAKVISSSPYYPYFRRVEPEYHKQTNHIVL